MKGLFITFEGVDGCGKSTQMRLLCEYLESKGFDIRQTREPGGCEIAEQIRDMLINIENSQITDMTEALLYAAARAQHVEEVIRPAVEAGKIVLCDRFVDSSLAYQGEGRSLGIETIYEINKYAIKDLLPDKTFFLDYPPQLAFERMSKKKVHDRLEVQSYDFYEKLYNGFKKLSDMYPERIIRIDAKGEKNQTHELIIKEMDKILAAR